jgi:hypothetical protein
VEDVEPCTGLRQLRTRAIEALLRKWLKILPHRSPPKTPTPATGMSCRSCRGEFSLTQMLDRPVSGRIFFEQVLHDNLDIAPPRSGWSLTGASFAKAGVRPRAGSAPG